MFIAAHDPIGNYIFLIEFKNLKDTRKSLEQYGIKSNSHYIYDYAVECFTFSQHFTIQKPSLSLR